MKHSIVKVKSKFSELCSQKLSKYPLIASASILLLLVGSMAIPFNAFALEVDPGVPPGLTRITVIHDFDGTRTEIDHGPGAKLPPRPHVSPACEDTDTNGTPSCDVDTWRGWSWSGKVVYDVNLNGVSGNSDGYLQAIQDGSQAWDNANPDFEQEFGEVTSDTASGADKRKSDNKNTVDFGRTNKFGKNVIAITVFWVSNSGTIVEADMRFNNNLPWAANNISQDPDTSTNESVSSSYDVQNIATHEFGHFHAGLEDIDDPAASEITMFAFGARGEVKKRSLAVSDVNSFARAYGPLNDAPVVTITEPSNGSIFNTGDDDPINFKGNAIDTEDGLITSNLTWTTGDGTEIGTSGIFSTTLIQGTHTITASVKDSGNRIGSDTITITVGETPTPTKSSLEPIIYKLAGGKNGDKHLLITISLIDDLNSGVSDASVSISISRAGSVVGWAGTSTTGTEGTVTFQLSNARSGCYTTTVTNVVSDPSWDGNPAQDGGFCKN